MPLISFFSKSLCRRLPNQDRFAFHLKAGGSDGFTKHFQTGCKETWDVPPKQSDIRSKGRKNQLQKRKLKKSCFWF